MHTTPEDDQTAQNRLCAACIGEAFLQAKVEEDGEIQPCTYCGEEGKTFSLDKIADAVETAFEQHYYKTPRNPDSEDWPYNDDWHRKGEPVLYIIEDLVGVDETTARDLLSVLSDRHFNIEGARIGEECEFDTDAQYAEKGVSPDEFNAQWAYVENDLKTNARYFSRAATSILAEIFDGIGNLGNEDGRPVIVEAGPGQKIVALYRARVFQSLDKLKNAIERPDVELGPPPKQFAAAGRMNAFGISVFYGAVEANTAIAEVRPPVGSRVLLGSFELTRALRLLDVEALRAIYVKGSLFDHTFARNLERAKFLARLSRRMTKPVMPEEETFEHLATQAIADYLSSEADPKIDGIVYPSVQARSGKQNVVLFHKASRVERLQLPAGTTVESHCWWMDETEEDDPPEDGAPDDYGDDRYWVWEIVPPGQGSAPPVAEKLMIFRPWTVSDATEFDDRAPALRLNLETLEVRRIREVAFNTASYKVDRSRRDSDPSMPPVHLDPPIEI